MATDAFPPGPRTRVPLGHMPALQRDLLGFFREVQRNYGDVVGFRVGGRKVVVVSDPALIDQILVRDARRFEKTPVLKLPTSEALFGEGLLTSEGDLHRRHRRMIQPAFYPRRVREYGEIMTRWAEQWGRRWSDGDTVRMADEMRYLTLGIAAEALFGVQLEAELEEIREALEQMATAVRRINLPFARWIASLPIPANRRFHEGVARLDRIIYRLLREGRAAADRKDTLSLLAQARDDGDGQGLTDKQVRDHAMTLLLAGHDTTALATTYTWYLLAKHPSVGEKLRRELAEVLGGRAAAYDDLERLPYTRSVLMEAMRLWPPAYTVARTPKEDYPLGDYVAPAGCQLIMSQYVVQRNPRYYAEPDTFRPERWEAEGPWSMPRFTYYPFGGGPRTCIGEPFAWTEATLVLATLAQHWEGSVPGGYVPEVEPRITLEPRDGVPMTLHRREASAGPSSVATAT